MKFDRFIKLVGEENFSKIKDLKVTILGLGGVGSYVYEALVRSGVSNIVIIDKDVIDITNLNRQIMTNTSNIGEVKVDVLKQRGLSINKDLNVVGIKEFINEENIDILFKNNSDYVIDCCDTIGTKKAIIKECLNRNIKFITCMGMGKRLDPSKVCITTIDKTINDPLSKIIRKWVKDEKINKKIVCCSSTEIPIKTDNKEIASSIFVPATAGLNIASYVIRDFIK